MVWPQTSTSTCVRGKSKYKSVKHEDNPSQYIICTLCSKWFQNMSELHKHLTLFHLDPRYNECLDAGNPLKQKHIGFDPLSIQTHPFKRFKCDLCPVKFTTKKNLREHKRAKHSNTTDRYRCVCGLTFRWRSTFANHKRKCEQLK